MTYSMTKKEIPEQTVLVGRRRVSRSEIATAIGEVLPRVFQLAQKEGMAVTGPPFVRYTEVGSDLMTLEPGIPVALPEQASAAGISEPSGDEGDEIRRAVLPGGLVATTIHTGPYDKLHEAYAALQDWIGSQGLTAAGAPWESYLTDPTTVSDPQELRTEVYWPVR